MNLKQKIEQLEEQLEELKREFEDDWPQEGDVCWTVGLGYLDDFRWDGSWQQEELKEQGLLFEDRQEAETHYNWMKARTTIINKIKELNDGWEPDWEDFSEEKWYFGWSFKEKRVARLQDINIQYLPKGFQMKGADELNQLIDECEEEIRIYLGVK